MICYRCGREMPDKSPCCKGCGTQLRRPGKVRSAPLSQTLNTPVTIGKRTRKTWQVLLMLVIACALLIVALNVFSCLSCSFGSSDPEPEYTPGISHEEEEVLDAVTGTIISCTAPPADMTVTEEKALADGKWRMDCSTDHQTVLRFARMPASENWMNSHLYQFYPDVTDVDQYDTSPDVSGYSSVRIQFSSQEAPGCIIQAVCVSDNSFDHLFIVEMPLIVYEENDIFVDEWISHLKLIDAQSGEESLNPALLLNPSDSDTLVAIEG
ncbi:MAG: hypothetical protein E7554_03620 [Ruminococcaceae bacterium]|nr:hypothetical protein [Oscillospiraceae bacterium]